MSIFPIPEGRRATRDVSSKQLLSDGSGHEVDCDDEEDDAIENRCELGPALTLGINRNGVTDPACPDQAKKRSGADVEVKAVENDVQEIRRDLRNDPETKTSDGVAPTASSASSGSGEIISNCSAYILPIIPIE